MNKVQLRKLIEGSLRAQGFRLRANRLLAPAAIDKNQIRRLHEVATLHKRAIARKSLARHEEELLSCLANGNEIKPTRIAAELIEVVPGSFDELLFRYATLHWSIPISSGYGRRLRFLVMDRANDKLMGVIGLADPVFNLGARDIWIGWGKSARSARLAYVMDAFVLGAVPPYSSLLCGKLIAMLAASNEVRLAFKRKYSNRRSLIRHKRSDARLALLTTTSALGRSSVYNRLRFGERKLFHSVGFTRGSGEFHFANGMYSSIAAYASRYCTPTAKKSDWGEGFRSRREVLKKCLPKLGISTEWLYHGIEREIFAIPLAHNTRDFLAGSHSRLRWFDQPVDALCDYFLVRWLWPRMDSREYTSWNRRQWRLWD